MLLERSQERLLMKAIEFEAISDRHTLRVPESVPDGVKMRVLILIDETDPAATEDVKAMLCGIVEGLNEDDLARPRLS